MPAVISSQRANKSNGFDKNMREGLSSSLTSNDDSDSIRTKLANKKLDIIEQEHNQFNNGTLLNNRSQQETAEVFHDTHSLGAHASAKSSNLDDEPIVIFDTQSNTSIAQTAKDQFAAALLRLQSGLDDSSSRLDAIESKIDDIVRQQRQQTTRTNQASSNSSGWLYFTSDTRYRTILYLSWPVLVFVAMRALEKRALLKRLD